MIVYIVMVSVAYEGEAFIGAFSTLEKAKNKIAKILKDDMEEYHISDTDIQTFLKSESWSFDATYNESFYIFDQKIDED